MEKGTVDVLGMVRDYRHRLEHRMVEHMQDDESASRTSSFGDMNRNWMELKRMEDQMKRCHLGPEEMRKWVDGMKNADGTTGAHWTVDQTTAVAKQAGVLMTHVTPEEFWVVVNMMYSDYSAVADKLGVNRPEFFAEMAKAFLFDKDGPDPDDKLAGYYRAVVCYSD